MLKKKEKKKERKRKEKRNRGQRCSSAADLLTSMLGKLFLSCWQA
jgi:hypothetical protein